MEDRQFLIVTEDEQEQNNMKEICEIAGSSVICANNFHEAERYISSLTTQYCVIIDTESLKNDIATFCEKIKKISSEIFTVALRSVKDEDIMIGNYYCDAILLKPLCLYTLGMVLNNSCKQ